MKLPNPESAVVDERKLEEYLLNPEHPRGKHKARVFATACGIIRGDAGTLKLALLDAIQVREAAPGVADEYGRRFVVDFDLDGPTGTRTIKSVWIVRRNEDFARFVTCHVV